MPNGLSTEHAALTGTDVEKSDWFFGRLVAKDAIRALMIERTGVGVFPSDMEAILGDDGRYTCTPRDGNASEPFPTVAFATAGGLVAAVAAYSNEVGIALVPVEKNCGPDDERTARERAACLAVANALRIAPDQCSLSTFDAKTGVAIIAVSERTVRVQTAREKNIVVATTLCETP